jgi:hypothetical protein
MCLQHNSSSNLHYLGLACARSLLCFRESSCPSVRSRSALPHHPAPINYRCLCVVVYLCFIQIKFINIVALLFLYLAGDLSVVLLQKECTVSYLDISVARIVLGVWLGDRHLVMHILHEDTLIINLWKFRNKFFVTVWRLKIDLFLLMHEC